MKYPIKTRTIFEIDSDTFDEMVNDNIPAAKGQYESIPDNEWNNDSSYTTTISKEWNDKYAQKSFKKIESGDLKYIGWQTILAYLNHINIIPEGNYSIKVSW